MATFGLWRNGQELGAWYAPEDGATRDDRTALLLKDGRSFASTVTPKKVVRGSVVSGGVWALSSNPVPDDVLEELKDFLLAYMRQENIPTTGLQWYADGNLVGAED